MLVRIFYGGLISLASSVLLAVSGAIPAAAAGQIIISNTTIQKITENSATISWTTSVPTVSEVDFGPSTQYGSVVSDPQATTQHRVTLHSSLLLPGVTYHFITKNNDQNGTVAVSDDGFFTTRGTQLNVQVVDIADKPIENAVVSWNDREDTTNAGGWAILPDLPPGNTIVAIQYQGVGTAAFVQVVPSAKHAQSIRLSITPATETGGNLLITGAALLIGTGLGLALAQGPKVLAHTKFPKRFHARPMHPGAKPADHDLGLDFDEHTIPSENPVKTKLSMSVSELHDRFFGDGR